MTPKHQLTVFCLCVAVGFVGGIVYELFALFRWLFRCERGKNKRLGVVLDVLYFSAFALICTYAAYALRFPSFRAYMWIGYAVGGIFYGKTLRRIVAFSEKVCYNRVTKAVKRRKGKKKFSKTEE